MQHKSFITGPLSFVPHETGKSKFVLVRVQYFLLFLLSHTSSPRQPTRRKIAKQLNYQSTMEISHDKTNEQQDLPIKHKQNRKNRQPMALKHL